MTLSLLWLVKFHSVHQFVNSDTTFIWNIKHVGAVTAFIIPGSNYLNTYSQKYVTNFYRMHHGFSFSMAPNNK